jgi:hypothetical protein
VNPRKRSRYRARVAARKSAARVVSWDDITITFLDLQGGIVLVIPKEKKR